LLPEYNCQMCYKILRMFDHSEGMRCGKFVVRRCLPHLLACMILLSCAAKPSPVVIHIEVRAGYKGMLHVTPCADQARVGAAGERGIIYAVECPRPGQEIELVVVQGGQTYRIPSEKLSVSRTGDGIPVDIIGQIE
jgi:hypothetical protein